MSKSERVDLVLRILGLFQTLPLMAVASEEATAIKQLLKALHEELHKDLVLEKTPQLTGENYYASNGTPPSS